MKKMVSLYLTIAIIVAVLMTVLGTVPSKVYVDKSDNLRLRTILGFSKRIPLAEMTLHEMPEGALKGLIRTFGTSVGNLHSGKFYSRAHGTTYNLFITQKIDLTYFEYNGKKYIVDSWE